MEFGIFTFADWLGDPVTGEKISAKQRMKEILEEAKLCDELGIEVYGIGEHHREEYLSAEPSVILAAIAAQTKNIRLTSAVSVISSDDPVRVFQRFAELDLISNGRAEIMAGRGSFTESFPLFGYDLSDYKELYEEKLDLLLKIREDTQITWNGTFREPIKDLPVYPRPVQDPLPVWIASGGNPGSAVRAAELGLPLALAIIGGRPEMFTDFFAVYRDALNRFEKPKNTPVSVNSHGFIADTSQKAKDTYFPYYRNIMNIIGKDRGWPPVSKDRYDMEVSQKGALVVGSPEEVAEKIIYEHELFNMDRFGLQITISTMPHTEVMKSIELFGTKVKPIVEKAIS